MRDLLLKDLLWPGVSYAAHRYNVQAALRLERDGLHIDAWNGDKRHSSVLATRDELDTGAYKKSFRERVHNACRQVGTVED